MGKTVVLCSRCGARVEAGVRYCPQCGEAVDPELVAELRHLYTILQQLDAWIGEGRADQSLATVRADLVSRYLSLRTPPADAAITTTTTSTASAAASVAVEPSAPLAQAEAVIAAESAPPSGSSTVAVTPLGPVFSWRAFIAEQAIAIMAYLGAFLLLVATLSFEVGGWQVLDNTVKLVAVCAVYIVFGALGAGLRRVASLGTVSRVYLAVFALMTPLVALAVYRFELQERGFSPAGMVCLAAMYAAVIYLALAWRTRFEPYAYLGWSALVVAALSIVPWTGAEGLWQLFALAAVSLALLLPNRLRRVGVLAALEEPARQLALLTSGAAALPAVGVGLNLLSAAGDVSQQLTPFVAVSGALTLLAALWSVVLRGAGWRAGADVLDAFDWLVAAYATQTGVAIAAWLGADSRAQALVLSGLALGELAVALVLRIRWRARLLLRRGVEALALALTVIAPAIVAQDAAPDMPLVVGLSVGLFVAAVTAVAERTPWWLLVAGAFLSLDHLAILAALRYTLTMPAAAGEVLVTNSLVALVCVLWLVGLALASLPRTRAWAAPVLVIALGNALFSLVLLPVRSPAFQTAALAGFALAALVVGVRGGWVVPSRIVTVAFGLLAAVPLTLHNTDGVGVAVVALVAAGAALAVRRLLGRTWAYAPYAVAFWAALLVWWQLTYSGESTYTWSLLTVPFITWVLLALGALACLAAWWEDVPYATAAPAALALLGMTAVPHHPARVALVFVLAGIGVGWRQWRGRWWNVAWGVAAALASLYAVQGLAELGHTAQVWLVVIFLSYAVVAYLIALHERSPWLTILAALYAIAALQSVPEPSRLTWTLVLTFASAGLGAGVRRLAGWRWALALYSVALVGTLFAVTRVVPYDAGTVEALLLIFAAVAYLVATVVERRPLAGIVPALYGCAAALLQPDAHALLPLALVLGVLALLVSRSGGPRWAWPLYAAAAVAGVAAAINGQPEPRLETLALAALAALAYVVAAVESRPDVLALPFLLGALALAAGMDSLAWREWQRVLAFAALSWLYFAGQGLWRRIPGLRPRGGAWWADARRRVLRAGGGEDPRTAGAALHAWAGLLLGTGTAVVALGAPRAFAVRAGPTEAAVIALLALAGLLALHSRRPRMYVLRYLAGAVVAVAISWQARWLGADNLQAFVLAPGSYLILIGALVPADSRLGHPRRAGQALSLAGALVLLLPTLGQSFQSDPNWLYALLLALEALVIAGVGVGTRSRLLVLAGSVFVGAAALRGAVLAVSSGVPVALVIAGLALLLMGGATWLSLQTRRGADELSR
jgi:hypothetical protein